MTVSHPTLLATLQVFLCNVTFQLKSHFRMLFQLFSAQNCAHNRRKNSTHSKIWYWGTNIGSNGFIIDVYIFREFSKSFWIVWICQFVVEWNLLNRSCEWSSEISRDVCVTDCCRFSCLMKSLSSSMNCLIWVWFLYQRTRWWFISNTSPVTNILTLGYRYKTGRLAWCLLIPFGKVFSIYENDCLGKKSVCSYLSRLGGGSPS